MPTNTHYYIYFNHNAYILYFDYNMLSFNVNK